MSILLLRPLNLGGRCGSMEISAAHFLRTLNTDTILFLWLSQRWSWVQKSCLSVVARHKKIFWAFLSFFLSVAQITFNTSIVYLSTCRPPLQCLGERVFPCRLLRLWEPLFSVNKKLEASLARWGYLLVVRNYSLIFAKTWRFPTSTSRGTLIWVVF